MKQKYFVLIFLYFIGVSAVFSQTIFSNAGVLVVSSGTQVSAGLGDGTDQFTNLNTGTITNNGNLYLKGNYENNGVINIGTGTTTFNQRDTSPSETIQNISGTGAIEFYNLTLNNNTSLGVFVEDGIGLLVANNLYLQEGDLRLEGGAQLIQTSSTNVNTSGVGKLLIDRSGNGSRFGYHYFSSPVNSAGVYTLNTVLFDGTDSSLNPFSPTAIQFTTGGDGVPASVDGTGVTVAATIGTEFTYQFLNGDINDSDAWIEINETTSMSPGLGYTMKGTKDLGDPNQNYTFKGQPNNGVYNFTLNRGKSALLGNPYSSAIDTQAFILGNFPTIVEVQFWVDGGSGSHELANYLGGYAIRNVFGGVSGSVPANVAGGGTFNPATVVIGQYMSVGQGFFVESSLNANAVVEFKNSMRIFVEEDDPSQSRFFKSSNKKGGVVNRLGGKNEITKEDTGSYIRIGYEDPEKFHRQLLLGFLPNVASADLNFNRGYDTKIYDPREDELFFVIENDYSKQYVIQGVGDFNEDDVFPLSLKITEEGVHTIMLDDVKNFNNNIFIFDKILSEEYNLTEGEFNPNLGPGEYSNRFELRFKSSTTLSVDDRTEANFNVFYSNNNSIIIANKKNNEIHKVNVFNMLGQQLLTVKESKLKESKIEIPFNQNQGVYLVIVETNNGKETFRIIN